MGIATQYEGGLKFSGDQMYITTSAGTTLLTLGNTGNATFAGGVTTSNLFLGSSTVRISPGSNGEIGLNYNTSATGSLVWYAGGTASKFNVTNAGNATFAGTIGATNFSGSSSGTNTGDQILPTASSLGAVTLTDTQTISGAKTFSSASNHYKGHLYYDSYDSAGNHYFHFNDGAAVGGTTVNWRQYYGTQLKTHTWTSDDLGNMTFTFQGDINANGGNISASSFSHGELRIGTHAVHSGYTGLWNTEASTTTTEQYLIISAGTDTYINGDSVYIRAGNNSSSNELRVQTTGVTIGGNSVWHSGDFSSTNVSNWNTAYGWGNHASAGYLTSSSTDLDSRYYTESEVTSLLSNYRKDTHFTTNNGYSDYYSGGTAGWYKAAEIVLTSNCFGATLYGTLYDHRYDGADTYKISIVARAECDFTTNNESHYVNIGCTILGSTNYNNYRDKIRAILVESSDNVRRYEIQFYETPWNRDTWQLQSNGSFTIYEAPQPTGTATGTAKVNYRSTQNADYQRANTAMYAPLYYDSNNTDYYLDPAGTSVLNALTVGGSSVLTTANEGSGNGIDADSVDGYHASRLLRIDSATQNGPNFTSLIPSVNESYFKEVHQIETGVDFPSGAYTYGYVQSTKMSNMKFQWYVPHTASRGDNNTLDTIYFRTGWGDTQMYGWRYLIHSGNIAGQTVASAGSADSVAWDNVSGKPSTFAPSSHNHDGLYLGISAKAADSELLDGIDSVNFVYGNAKGTNDLGASTDADSIDKTGYYTSSAFTTRPSSVSNWMYIEHIKLYNSNTRYQKQIGYDTYDNRMWVRTKNDNTWTAWAQVWTSDVFSNNSANWDTAYGWGNHANAGYLTSETDSQTLTFDDSNGELTISNGNTVDLDARYLDATSRKTWFGINANGTQAKRYRIGRVYYCPAHWDDTWQNIKFKLTEETYSGAFVEYSLFGYYNGTQNQTLDLRVRDFRGLPSDTRTYSLELGEHTDAGWLHSGQPVYYTDIFVDVSYYKGLKVMADTLGHSWQSTDPTSGAGITVFYSTPQVVDITYTNVDKVNTYVGYDTLVWNTNNFSSTNVSNWDTAYGWGNHANAGYLTTSAAATTYAAIGHNHDSAYAAAAHDHDDRYHRLDFDQITGAHETSSNSGTWTGGAGTSWGSYKPGDDSAAGSYYNDGTGYAEYNIPSGYTTAYIGQLKWDSGGYFDVYAVDSNGNLVLRGRYMSLQTIENSNHNGNHDYQQIIKISGLDGFSSIRIQNRTGRLHLQGIGWTKEQDSDSTADALSHWDLIYGKPSTFAPSTHTHDDRYYTETEVDTLLGTKAASTHGHVIGDISDSYRWWNNFGENHTTRSNFNDDYNFGWRYIQGNTNGPDTNSATQYYSVYVGLGNDYGNGQYGMQVAYPRNVAKPYISVRYRENTAWGQWQKISAVYADSAGAVAWTAVSGKPTTFSPSAHTHTPSEVGLGNLSSSGNALAGAFTATGDITAFSDARVKENVETIPNALEKVTALRGVNFNKIGDEKRSTGVIAQEVREVLPEVIHENEDGMLSVAYGNITGVLIEAIKEQQKQIEELKAQLNGFTK